MFSISKVITKTTVKPSVFSRIHCKLCSTKNRLTTEERLPTQEGGVTAAHTATSSGKRWKEGESGELYGQPTPSTHPHLMPHGNELVPGVTLDEFQERRSRFMRKLTDTAPEKRHVVVVPSACKQYMTEKIPYVFRQNSDFLYLTGCQEPDSVLVMTSSGKDGGSSGSTIFVRMRDAHSELWDGPRTGVERAPALFGIDQALPFTELKGFLKPYFKHTSAEQSNLKLWYDHMNPAHPEVNRVMKRLNEKVENELESPRPHVHRMRLIKSKSERRLMQTSCNIASEAIRQAMRATRPGMTEHQLYATLDYESRMRGAEFLAYPPVVASGSNATIIHYIDNTQRMDTGDMVLVDTGCEYHGYASDITRTWPVDGKFTDAQRVLYEVCLTLQLELIDLCRDLPSLDNLFQFMCRSLGLKLREAGVFSKVVPDDKLAKSAYELCPHHVSHYLGMDVHDTATVTRSVPLEPGMVVTVEPGVYVARNNTSVRPEFRGLGVRIEDDVLITEDGPVVLSANCPKEVEDVERLASSSSS